MRVEMVPGSDEALRAALIAAKLPVDDLDAPGRQFYRFAEDGAAIGYGGLEPYGEVALLRSLVVTPQHRGRGKGRAVAEALLARARGLGASEVYLLATDAAPFFMHLGFTPTDRARAPDAIRNTQQATTICSTAALLFRSTR
jgi:N-acetylglutamate synthase-like GNAT family acetyltransferase